MLVLSSVIVSTAIDPESFSGTYDVQAEFRYNDICTNFDHDLNSTSFSGRALLNGTMHASLVSSGSTATTYTMAAPPLTLTVGGNSLLVTNSTELAGTASVTGGITSLSMLALIDDEPLTSITYAAQITFSLSNNVMLGFIGGSGWGYEASGGISIPYDSGSFSVTRGGTCNV